MMNKEHYEELIYNLVGYLWEIWNNEGLDTVKNNFKRLGFTDKDLEYFEISSEIEYLKSQKKGGEENE